MFFSKPVLIRDYKVVKETSALNRVPTGLKRMEDNVLGTPKSR